MEVLIGVLFCCSIPFYMSSDCENLLRKFLVLNPAKRATLETIMRDKWMNMGYEDDELKPFIEASADPKDLKRIGEEGTVQTILPSTNVITEQINHPPPPPPTSLPKQQQQPPINPSHRNKQNTTLLVVWYNIHIIINIWVDDFSAGLAKTYPIVCIRFVFWLCCVCVCVCWDSVRPFFVVVFCLVFTCGF